MNTQTTRRYCAECGGYWSGPGNEAPCAAPHGKVVNMDETTMNATDHAILRYGQTPNVIVGPDTATVSGAIQDCAACGGHSAAHWIAYAPSMTSSGYRVVGMCRSCANRYVADGRAVDRRPTGDLAAPEYQRFYRALHG